MPKIYYETDYDINVLKGKTVMIIGCGSQGHAHALNLHDGGVNVVVGLYEGNKNIEYAGKVDLKVLTVPEAIKTVDVIVVLTPDERQAEIYKKDIESDPTDGKAIASTHDFSIHFGQIKPPKFMGVFMIAPKGPGHTVRSEFQEGKGTPYLAAAEQDHTGHAFDVALVYGADIGGARAAVMETTFHVEIEIDLFGRQVVPCGDVCALTKAGFETLTEAGYAPENTYFECIHEMKLIVDLIYRGGFELMRYSISDTTEFGDYESGKCLITDDTKKEMKQILSEIQDGTFASKRITENESDRAYFDVMRRIESEHQLESVGKELCKIYSWNEEDEYAD